MSRFYVDTAMLRNQAQKMQACANKVGNFKYQIDRVSGRLKDIAELSLSDAMIDMKFRSLGNSIQTLAANFKTVAGQLSEIAEIYEAAQKYNMAQCTGNTAGLPYEDILQIRADNAVEPVSRKLYLMYLKKVKIADDAYQNTAYYDPATQSIKYNATADSTNVRGAGCTYFHEVGHLIDDLSDKDGFSSVDERYDFYNLLKSDFDNYVNQVMAQNGYTKIADAYKHISRELLTDGDMKNGISDIISGLTGGQCVGGWAHDQSYYTKESIAKEAFAHFFEAGMSSQETKLNYIKEIFPNAYNEYLRIAEDELNSLDSIDKILYKVSDIIGINNSETAN